MIRRKNIFFLFILLAIFTGMNTSAVFAQTKRSKKPSVTKKINGKSKKKKIDDEATYTTSDNRRRKLPGDVDDDDRNPNGKDDIKRVRKAVESDREEIINDQPKASKLKKAGSFDGDVRTLKYKKPVLMEAPEREAPYEDDVIEGDPLPENPKLPDGPTAAAPSPLASFIGLDYATWGSGRPPDTVGDVGPNHFIQSVNGSVGIYRKTDGARLAAFTLNTFMSQGAFGNLCDTNNFGDPVVLYDTFEDRWIITDFAFTLDGSGNVTSNSYQCFAASKTSDPIAGGWNFYSTVDTDALGDYPKFGVWNDGIYMSANMFGKSASGSFQTVRVRALNKAQMYAGNSTVQVVSFDIGGGEFTVLPSNARLQTGTPPAGTPNLMSVISNYVNAISVYKFKVDWNKISTSTLTGPSITLAPASWSSAPSTVPTSGTNNNDTLATRLMVQNQYTNIGGVESLWNTHTVRGSTAAISAIRYYQVNVTGGVVAATTTQAFTHAPDTTNRYIPSIAVNRAGDMALLYTASSSTLIPAIRYAGRLSTDAINTLPQTETDLIAGGGTQSSSTRWGDYSTMTLDPNGCNFWMTSEYFATTGTNWLTRIGSFAFPTCTPLLNNGVLQGTVTSAVTGLPISGATIAFGSRTATTNASGFYSFSPLPAGTYISEIASAPGYSSGSAANLVVSDGTTTTQNFALANTSAADCTTDTTQSDFQTGVPNNIDLTTSAGDALLTKPLTVNQNTTVTSSGFGFSSTAWVAQTFTPTVSGEMTQADLNLFCSGCTGTTPNLTVSIRATTGTTPVPTGADLATGTIAGFNSGSGGYYSAVFASPLTLTAGTRYALVLRANSNPSAGTYAYVCSCAGTGTVNSNPYANGQRVTSADSGANWTADVTSGGRDLGFKAYINTGYTLTGDLTSSTKDANSVVNGSTVWGSLTWTASTPTGTSIKFQVAGSNNANGPFNFVGPNGTAATYFTTNGASLSQFNGLRYLKYKAYLSTTDSTVTPTLNDVTVCYTNSNYEADVAGRPNGDGSIQSNDVVEMLRFLNEIDVPNTTVGEFQRADSAPRTTNGNGVIDSADVIQTLRFLNEIDSPQVVGGPSSPTPTLPSSNQASNDLGKSGSVKNKELSSPSAAPELRIENAAGSAGNPVTVNVRVDAVGNESQYSFAVLYNTSVLTYTNYAAGTTSSGTFSCNTTATAGRLRCSIGNFSGNQTGTNAAIGEIAAGNNQILIKMIFTINSGAAANSTTPLTLTGQSASDENATSITPATTNGMVSVSGPTAATVSVSGRVVVGRKGLLDAVVTLTDQTGARRIAKTSSLGYYHFDDIQTGQTYVIAVKSRGYQFTPQVINVVEDLKELNFFTNEN